MRQSCKVLGEIGALVFIVFLTACTAQIRLQKAVRLGDVASIAEALKDGAAIDSPGRDGYTPLGEAASTGNLATIEFLVTHGAKVNMVDYDGGSSVGDAAEAHFYKAAEFLANHGVIPNGQDLLKVAKDCNVGAAKFLIEHGAALEDSEQHPALSAAAQSDCLEVARLLIDKGADVNGRRGWRPLEGAALGNGQRVAKLLLDHGADVNADNGVALVSAAAFGQTAMVRLLLERGADTTVTSPAGETLVQIATRLNHPEIVQLINEANQRRATASEGTGLSKQDVQSIVEAAVSAGAAQKTQAQSHTTSSATVIHSDVDVPRYRIDARPDDFAIVVGVEKYDDDLPAAAFSESDAKAMRAHLLALGFPERNVIMLTNSSASRAGLVKNIERRLPEIVHDDSTVFFYYSGHGAPDPVTGKAYLVPFDGDPAYLEDTAYPVERLYRKLGSLKVKQVIVALDSCFSGAGGRSVLAKGTRPLVTKINEGQVPANVIALTASGASQIAGALDDQGHGAFTYFLLKGLNGAAEDDQGHVTVSSLFDYLKPKVEDAARRENRDQTPRLIAADGSRVELR